MFTPTLLIAFVALTLALLSVSAAPMPVSHTLEKRQSFGGRATFYDVGLGACGGYNVASDFIVALNAPQYGGGYPGPNCGRSITISYGGKSAQATIRDLCPGCGFGDLDMSRGLFNYFASESVGVFQMNWSYNDGSGGSQPAPEPSPEPEPEPTPTSTWSPPPPSSTSAWSRPASTSSWTPEPSSSSESDSDSGSASASSDSASASASASVIAPEVILNGTTVSAPIPTGAAVGMGNLVLLNQVITNFGAVIVAGARLPSS